MNKAQPSAAYPTQTSARKDLISPAGCCFGLTDVKYAKFLREAIQAAPAAPSYVRLEW